MRINERLIKRDAATINGDEPVLKGQQKNDKILEILHESGGLKQDTVDEDLFLQLNLGCKIRGLFDELQVKNSKEFMKESNGNVVNSSASNFNSWKQRLPYKLVGITKPEFLRNLHLDCLTCSESGTDDDECERPTEDESSSDYHSCCD